jgi:hypothetical protein
MALLRWLNTVALPELVKRLDSAPGDLKSALMESAEGKGHAQGHGQGYGNSVDGIDVTQLLFRSVDVSTDVELVRAVLLSMCRRVECLVDAAVLASYGIDGDDENRNRPTAHSAEKVARRTHDREFVRAYMTSTVAKYRGALLVMLAPTSKIIGYQRFIAGLSLVEGLTHSSIGTGCGYWLPTVLRALSKVRYCR